MMFRLFTTLFAAVVALLVAGTAQADFFPNNIDNLESYVNAISGGNFIAVDDVPLGGGSYTALAFEAGDQNVFGVGDDFLFANQTAFLNGGTLNGDPVIRFGEFVVFGPGQTFFFQDLSVSGPKLTFQTIDADINSEFISAFQLTADVPESALNQNLSGIIGNVLPIGTIIFGFDDRTQLANDDNGDDLIMAYIPDFTLQPIPVPAAVWLLGAGLAGLVGLRKRG